MAPQGGVSGLYRSYHNRNRQGVIHRFPLWLLLISLLFVFGYWKAVSDEGLRIIFFSVLQGLGVTVYVTLISFISAILLGLLIGILRSSKIYLVSQFFKFYVEIIRGLPILVVLYYIAFVLAPWLVEGYSFLVFPLTEMGWVEPLTIRDFGFLGRAVIALVIAYSAFIAEIFRAGIESIDTGQVEAAQSLGLTRYQSFLTVILPQAVRNILPALANELIAMLKDSALVSVLGVADITQMGKIYSTSTFKFYETYNIVALLYLSLTITLSLGVKWVERKFSLKKPSESF